MTVKTLVLLSLPFNLTWMAGGPYFVLRKPAAWPVERRRRVFGPFIIVGGLILLAAVLFGRT